MVFKNSDRTTMSMGVGLQEMWLVPKQFSHPHPLQFHVCTPLIITASNN